MKQQDLSIISMSIILLSSVNIIQGEKSGDAKVTKNGKEEGNISRKLEGNTENYMLIYHSTNVASENFNNIELKSTNIQLPPDFKATRETLSKITDILEKTASYIDDI